jgi:hypothetical protein
MARATEVCITLAEVWRSLGATTPDGARSDERRGVEPAPVDWAG